MRNPELIAAPPERTNIFLSVVDKKEVIEDVQVIASIVLPLEESGSTTFPKTLVYCRKYVLYTTIYNTDPILCLYCMMYISHCVINFLSTDLKIVD